MRKIPTVFKRDPEDMKRVLNEVTPGCEWVFDGAGTATRKFDGTCVMLDEQGRWWARREVKPGKCPPDDFLIEQKDENTGKTVGWEPVARSGFAKWHAEALAVEGAHELVPGTYELIGPKVNGNPEKAEQHMLIRHADAAEFDMLGGSQTYESVRNFVIGLGEQGIEGVVWHHPDGRMAKLKARDFQRQKVAA